MRSVFLCGGAREQALRYILEKGEEVVAVITPNLTDKNRRFEKIILIAIENGITVYPVNKDILGKVLSQLNYDILISCGFPYLIEDEIVSQARYAINVHPTLLPKYKGFRSGPYVVINGEKESGTTIHFLTSQMDQGDIIAQKSFPLSIFDTTRSIYRKNQAIEGPLLYKVLQDLKSDNVIPKPQDDTQSSVYSYIRTPDDSEIDWHRPLKDLYNEIRACDPDDYPAFFYLEGQKVCIKFWRPDKPDEESDMI